MTKGVFAFRMTGEVSLRERGRDIRRDRVKVRAEDDTGLSPGKEEVQGAVADLIDPQYGAVRRGEQIREALNEPFGHLPLLSRSGIDAQQLIKELKVHKVFS
jgi:hypothetical protein